MSCGESQECQESEILSASKLTCRSYWRIYTFTYQKDPAWSNKNDGGYDSISLIVPKQRKSEPTPHSFCCGQKIVYHQLAHGIESPAPNLCYHSLLTSFQLTMHWKFSKWPKNGPRSAPIVPNVAVPKGLDSSTNEPLDSRRRLRWKTSGWELEASMPALAASNKQNPNIKTGNLGNIFPESLCQTTVLIQLVYYAGEGLFKQIKACSTTRSKSALFSSYQSSMSTSTSSSTSQHEDATNVPAKNDPFAAKPKRSTLGRWEACSPCRARRTRCDGNHPACSPCTHAGRVCSYPEKQRPRGPPTHIELYARWNELQAQLQQLLKNREVNRMPVMLHQDVLGSPYSDLICQSSYEFSVASRDAILAIFFQNKHQAACTIAQDRFMRSLNNEDPLLQPHPALVDTILLYGILFVRRTSQDHILPSSVPDSNVLLSRIHKGLASSLGLVDRLLDHIQATALLSSWYFNQGRLQEGKYISAANFRLAVDCQLHRIDKDVLQELLTDPSMPSFWDCTILGRPRDPYELYLRVTIFWQCYLSESINSLTTGLPSACDGAIIPSITTVWPRPLSEYELNLKIAIQFSKSMEDLFSGNLEDFLDEDSLRNLDIQGLVLINCAVEMASSASGTADIGGVERLAGRIQALGFALRRFKLALQSLEAGERLQQFSNQSRTHIFTTSLAECVARIHFIRSAEILTAQKATYERSSMDRTNMVQYRILNSLGLQEESFDELSYTTARNGIQAIHASTINCMRSASKSQVPSICGFLLASPAVVVARQLNTIEAKLVSNILRGTPTSAMSALSASVEDAKEVFAQALSMMTMLAADLPLLNVQIEKVLQVRNTPLVNE